MDKSERLIFFYDISIKASSRSFDNPKAISIKKAFELMGTVSRDKMTKSISKDTCLLYVSAWEHSTHNNQIHILVNRSDKNIPDPIFSTHTNQTRREIKKTKQEGQDYSAHIIIQLPKSETDPALLLIEQNRGLSISTIKILLDEILKLSKDIPDNQKYFIQNHPDGSVDKAGKKRTYNVIFKTEFLGHISQELQNDLDNGKVQSIEVITDFKNHKPFDNDGYIEERKNVLHLGLREEKKTITGRLRTIKNAIQKKKPDFTQAKIRFKTATDISRTITIEPNNTDTQYIKREKITDFTKELLSSYKDLDSEIIHKMKEFIPKET